MKERKGICVGCGEAIFFTKGTKPMNCPTCGYGNDKGEWIKPPLETELFLLQLTLFSAREQEDVTLENTTLGEMFLVLHTYAKGKVKKLLGGRVIYSQDDIDSSASDAANMMINYFITKPHFRIDSSFGSYLEKQVKSVLYNSKNRFHDSIFSLNDVLSQDKEKEALQNFQPLLTKHIEYSNTHPREHAHDVVAGIGSVLTEILRVLRSGRRKEFNLQFLVCLKHTLHLAKHKQDPNLYSTFGGLDMKATVEKGMIAISEFIRE